MSTALYPVKIGLKLNKLFTWDTYRFSENRPVVSEGYSKNITIYICQGANFSKYISEIREVFDEIGLSYGFLTRYWTQVKVQILECDCLCKQTSHPQCERIALFQIFTLYIRLYFAMLKCIDRSLEKHSGEALNPLIEYRSRQFLWYLVSQNWPSPLQHWKLNKRAIFLFIECRVPSGRWQTIYSTISFPLELLVNLDFCYLY